MSFPIVHSLLPGFSVVWCWNRASEGFSVDSSFSPPHWFAKRVFIFWEILTLNGKYCFYSFHQTIYSRNHPNFISHSSFCLEKMRERESPSRGDACSGSHLYTLLRWIFFYNSALLLSPVQITTCGCRDLLSGSAISPCLHIRKALWLLDPSLLLPSFIRFYQAPLLHYIGHIFYDSGSPYVLFVLFAPLRPKILKFRLEITPWFSDPGRISTE